MFEYLRQRKWRTGLAYAIPEAMHGGPTASDMLLRGVRRGWNQAGFSSVADFSLLAVPSAIMAAMAPRGHKVASVLSSLISWPIAAVVGGALGDPTGGMLAGALLVGPIERTIHRGIESFIGLHGQYATLHMGGWYRDTQAAYTMRQQAVNDMSGSLMNARQYLGREAHLMHQ